MPTFLSSSLVFGTLSATAAPVASPPAPPPPAVATGKWVVEFENERCTAARSYSDGNKQFAIGFQPKPTQEFMYVIVQVPKRVEGLGTWKARVSMGAGPWSERRPVVVPSTKSEHSRFSFAVERQQVEQLVQDPNLRIETEKGPRIHVRLTSFAEVLKTLKGCEAGLLADWGLPLEAQKSLASFPKPQAIHYFRAEDYPRKALDRSAVGAIEARVTVGTDGKVLDCHILDSSGHKDLDAITCANYVRRARFEPARDRSGKPVVSPYVYKVTWRVE